MSSVYVDPLIVNSPSPVHQHRIAREHYFATSFRGVKAQIIDGKDFVSPKSMSKVKDPQIFARLGSHILEGPIGSLAPGEKNHWKFDGRFEFPYRGELRLRFFVKDHKGHDIGFHDINLFDQKYDQPVFTSITLGGVSGPAGVLNVAIEPVLDVVESPMSRRANGEVIRQVMFGMTPAAAAATLAATASPGGTSTKAVSQLSSSVSSSLSSSVQEILEEANYGKLNQFELSLVNGVNLVNGAKPGVQQDIYVKAKMGHHKLETPTIKSAGTNPQFRGDRFIFPYKGEAALDLKVYANLNNKNDPLLGSATVRLGDYFAHNGTQIAPIPLYTKKGVSAGMLNASLKFSSEPTEVKATVFSADNPVGDNGSSTTSSSSGGANISSAGKASGFKSLKLTILEAEALRNAREPEKSGNIYPFIKARLGNEWLKTSTIKKGGDVFNPKFGEVFYWPYDGRRSLKVEAWDDGKMRNHKLCSSKLDLNNYLNSGPQRVAIPLAACGKDGAPFGKLHVILDFLETPESIPRIEALGVSERALEGSSSPAAGMVVGSADPLMSLKFSNVSQCRTLRIVLESATGLKKQHMDTLDPYVAASLGDATLKTAVYKDAGCDPKFSDMLIFPYNNHQNVMFEVFDSRHMMSDPLLGKGSVNLEPYLYLGEMGHDIRVKLFDKKNNPSGTLNIRLECVNTQLEANPRIMKLRLQGNDQSAYRSVQIGIHKIERLTSGSAEDDVELDSYVTGKLGHEKRRSRTAHNSTRPIYNDVFVYPIKDAKKADEIEFHVYSNRDRAQDKKLATAVVDLGSWKARGVGTALVPLVGKKVSQGHMEVVYRFLDSPFSGEEVIHLKPGQVLHELLEIGVLGGGSVGNAALKSTAGPVQASNYVLTDSAVPSPELSKSMTLTSSSDREEVAAAAAGAAIVDESVLEARSLSSSDIEDVKAATIVYDEAKAMQSNTMVSRAAVPAAVPGGVVESMAGVQTVSPMKLENQEWMQVVDFPHECQSLRVFVLQGRDLKNPHMIKAFDKVDAYVQVTIGDDMLKTESQHDEGTNPTFNNTLAFPYHGRRAMKVEVYDKAMGSDPLIGSAVVGLEHHLKQQLARTSCLEVPLSTEKGKPAGYLYLYCDFSPLPLGSPQVEIHNLKVPPNVAAKIAAIASKKKKK